MQILMSLQLYSMHCHCQLIGVYRTSKFCVFFTGNIDALLKSFNKKLKKEHVLVDITATLTEEGIYLRFHNGQYCMIVLCQSRANIIAMDTLADSVLLALKLHYVFNVNYRSEPKSLYGVIELLLGLKSTVKLGSFAVAFAKQLLDSP